MKQFLKKIGLRLQLGWVFLLHLFGCGKSNNGVEEHISPTWPNVDSVETFTSEELKALREYQITIYRGKVILDAQPPISQPQLDEIQALLTDEIPEDLIELWKLSFGGRLDYDYDVVFGSHVFSASLKELFYTDSDHYRDIIGWTKDEMYNRKKSQLLPFAGFEYLERAFIILDGEERGKILYWAQGLPPAWKTRLNEDSISITANSFSELFDQLYLSANPFAPESEDNYANGLEMAEMVEAISLEQPDLAKKLRTIIEENVFDWRTELSNANKGDSFNDQQLRAMRLALVEAASKDDVEIVKLFRERKFPLDLTIRAESGLLPEAMRQGSFEVVAEVIKFNLDAGNSTIVYIDKGANPGLVDGLINRGMTFDIEAVINLAEHGEADSAASIVTQSALSTRLDIQTILDQATERKDMNQKRATEVETGKLISSIPSSAYEIKAVNTENFIQLLKQL